MNYFEIIVLIVSFLAIIISLFAICLAMMFYRLHSQLSLLVTEMSKGLEMSTVRLERIPKLLYNQNVVLIDQERDKVLSQRKTSEEKKQDKGLGKQNLPEENDLIV